MSFITDRQTLNDLNIFGKAGQKSIFEIYNKTNTRKGAEVLEHMFKTPLCDIDAINKRSGIIHFFTTANITFPFKGEHFDYAELYLQMKDQRTRLTIEDATLEGKLKKFISEDINYKNIYNGITAIIDIIHLLKAFIIKIQNLTVNHPYLAEVNKIDELLNQSFYKLLLQENINIKLSYAKIAEYDKELRFNPNWNFNEVLGYIYYLDVYLSVAQVAVKHKYNFPVAMIKGLQFVNIEGLYHPLIDNPVANSINITPESNILFLTGANMAGKSTFMKSLGIAILMAHTGFPVAAQKMEFGVMDGLYTTINLADDIDTGSSHFYAEVLRIKKIAKEAGMFKNLFIIFDELFRGTNVKDAFEATVAITEAFARKKSCVFVVSTHIVETGEILKSKCRNINFIYLPTYMDKNRPVYTYSLAQGITEDRHGMVIINNEGILEILNQKKRTAQSS